MASCTINVRSRIITKIVVSIEHFARLDELATDIVQSIYTIWRRRQGRLLCPGYEWLFTYLCMFINWPRPHSNQYAFRLSLFTKMSGCKLFDFTFLRLLTQHFSSVFKSPSAIRSFTPRGVFVRPQGMSCLLTRHATADLTRFRSIKNYYGRRSHFSSS